MKKMVDYVSTVSLNYDEWIYSNELKCFYQTDPVSSAVEIDGISIESGRVLFVNENLQKYNGIYVYEVETLEELDGTINGYYKTFTRAPDLCNDYDLIEGVEVFAGSGGVNNANTRWVLHIDDVSGYGAKIDVAYLIFNKFVPVNAVYSGEFIVDCSDTDKEHWVYVPFGKHGDDVRIFEYNAYRPAEKEVYAEYEDHGDQKLIKLGIPFGSGNKLRVIVRNTNDYLDNTYISVP